MNFNKKMKVCLINPPVIQVLEPWYDTPDFGRTALAYLAAYLNQFPEFESYIIDAKLERLTFTQVVQRIQSIQPEIVGFTAYTNEIKPAAYQALKIKEINPDLICIIGGVHLTAIPKETMMEFPVFDIGVVGEGEITFYELCKNFYYKENNLSQINGLIYRSSNELKQTPPRERILDQDSIPYPAWELMPPAKTYFVQSIRGCPFNCLFCMNPNGRVARKRSVENVMGELLEIIKKFKPERISFGDELFSVDMPRTKKLLDEMIKHNIGEKVSWDVQTHVHYVDAEMFGKFKKAKVTRVELGIETGDEDALRKMGKGTKLETILKACEAAKTAQVPIGTFFLFGQPNETIESLQKTVDFAVKINPDLPMFGLMTPYPGTEVAKMAANHEGGYRLLSTDWDEYNKQIGGAMTFANLSRRQIEWYQTKAYLKVYLLNRRYIDFAKFVWEYRKAAWEVFKKMLLGRTSIIQQNFKPADYDQLLQQKYKVENATFIQARNDWKIVQQNELKRSKLTSKEI